MHKKQEKTLAEKLTTLDSVISGINKSAQKTIITRLGTDKTAQEKLRIKWIPTPAASLNEAIGSDVAEGGFPRGKMTLIVGDPDSAKTGTVLQTIAYNQKKDPNFVGALLESEHSVNTYDLENTYGIDLNRFIFLEHDRDGAGEKALDRAEALIASGCIDLFCVNSLKCLVPSEDFEKTFEQSSVGTQARMNSKMVRKFTSILSETDTAFVVITHLSTEIGKMFGDPKTITGGEAIKYGALLTLDFKKSSIGKQDPIERDEGLKIAVKVRKNHCIQGRNPYKKSEFYVIFGEGIEQYLQILSKAIEKKILVQNGSFIKEIDKDGQVKEWNGQKLQFQGKNAYREFCKDNPDWFETIKAQVQGEISTFMSAEEIEELQKENKKMGLEPKTKDPDEDIIDIANKKKSTKKK